MSKAVDRKCHIGENHKSQYTTNSNCFHPAFIPTEHRYKHRQNETTCNFEKPIVPIKIKYLYYKYKYKNNL